MSISNTSETPKSSSSPTHKPEDTELDSDNDNILSPLDKSLLPLGHDDSKILDDNEIDEVLNEGDFILFPGIATVSDLKPYWILLICRNVGLPACNNKYKCIYLITCGLMSH